MNPKDQPAVLAVCLAEAVPPSADPANGLYRAESGRQALAMMRLLRIDLLLTSLCVPDTGTWGLISKVKRAWPWQKWALVGQELTPDEEVQARALGVLRIFDTAPDERELYSLAASVQRKAAAARPPAGTVAESSEYEVERT